MGKSFELLGMAAFNIMVAIILSTTFLTGASPETVNALTQENVEGFVSKVADITSGKNEDIDQFTITEYLMTHINDDGVFVSKINYGMADMMDNEHDLEMDKMTYISHTISGLKSMQKHETAVRIEHIEIADNARSATVTTTNYERGIMPYDDGFGDPRMIPVVGTSYCEQRLVLSTGNIIQMAGADCNTNIDFNDQY